MNPLIQKACDILGGQTALANALTEKTGEKVTQQRVRNWLVREGDVPTDFMAAIEDLTGQQVTRKQMSPSNWQIIWPELAEPAAIPGTPIDGKKVREAKNGVRQVITDTRKFRE